MNKRIICIIIILFIPLASFAQTGPAVHAQLGTDIEKYMQGYYEGWSALDVLLEITIKPEGEVLRIYDHWSKDSNDVIYQIFYLLQVIEYYHNDTGRDLLPIVYQSSSYNVDFDKPFLIEYMNTPKLQRYELYDKMIGFPVMMGIHSTLNSH